MGPHEAPPNLGRGGCGLYLDLHGCNLPISILSLKSLTIDQHRPYIIIVITIE
ncbi:hypothetical protein PRECH8_27750 [Insulibacter thermoxylanivorax]|uniref:Uncharacterized protein n=1 Tax=Insulibacter thermoxylanivorax TaxID=2749268 RepID=A0A916QGX2_9BACL|nr:hypothetical protein PRECH8_27750 [Insulibacter thermoxylanivorax]